MNTVVEKKKLVHQKFGFYKIKIIAADKKIASNKILAANTIIAVKSTEKNKKIQI
jgi:hypothetical protein